MDCAALVLNIRQRETRSVEDLYCVVSEIARSKLSQVIKSASIDDELHEILIVVLSAIERGELRDPGCLAAFIRTVARRQAVAHIRGNIAHRRRFAPHPESAPSPDPSPEERVARSERRQRLGLVLDSLRTRDREILVRFYFREQRPDQICAEMHLTPTQFRLYKSRALARCARRVAALGRSGSYGEPPMEANLLSSRRELGSLAESVG